jgi:hypothetical protein
MLMVRTSSLFASNFPLPHQAGVPAHTAGDAADASARTMIGTTINLLAMGRISSHKSSRPANLRGDRRVVGHEEAGDNIAGVFVPAAFVLSNSNLSY